MRVHITEKCDFDLDIVELLPLRFNEIRVSVKVDEFRGRSTISF
jgi:hypothetical protein